MLDVSAYAWRGMHARTNVRTGRLCRRGFLNTLAVWGLRNTTYVGLWGISKVSLVLTLVVARRTPQG